MKIGDDNICPVTKLPCDDECCPPGAECNMGQTNISEAPPDLGIPIKSDTASVLNALKAAAAALYFDDSADYQSALYEVVSELTGVLEDELTDDFIKKVFKTLSSKNK